MCARLISAQQRMHCCLCYTRLCCAVEERYEGCCDGRFANTWLAVAAETRASASCLMRKMCAAVSSWAAAAALSASWRVSASKACASCLRRTSLSYCPEDIVQQPFIHL